MIHLDNILNRLKLGNNWLNYKHSDKTKNLISEQEKPGKASERKEKIRDTQNKYKQWYN